MGHRPKPPANDNAARVHLGFGPVVSGLAATGAFALADGRISTVIDPARLAWARCGHGLDYVMTGGGLDHVAKTTLGCGVSSCGKDLAISAGTIADAAQAAR